MKNVRATIFIVMWACCCRAAMVKATVIYEDGGLYEVDYTIPDNLIIQDSIHGEPTIVNLVDGGSVKGYVNIFGNSQLNMINGSNGSVESHVFLWASSEFNMHNGSTGSVGGSVYLHDDSEFNMHEGSTATVVDLVLLTGTSTFNMSDGFIGEYIESW